MIKRSSYRLAIVTILAAICVSTVGQSTPPQKKEQTHFNAGDAIVERPVTIPRNVLTILERDNHVKQALNYEGIAPENLPASWFSASEIALGSSGEKDLIVAAEGPLIGANVDTF